MISVKRESGNGVTEQYFSDRHPSGLSVLWRITLMGIRHYKHFVSAIIFTFIGSAFFLWVPRLLGDGVDTALGMVGTSEFDQGQFRSLLITGALLVIAASAFRGVFAFLRMYIGEWLGQRVTAELRMQYFDKLQELSYHFHDNVHSGNLMSRGLSDIEGIGMYVRMGLVHSFYVIALFGIAAFFMISINPLLTVISLGFIPLLIIRSALLRSQLRRIWLQIMEVVGDQATHMQENMTGVKVVRAFSAQDYEENKFDKPAKDSLRLRIKAVGIQARGSGFMTFSFMLAWAGIIWFGGMEVVNGAMTVGEVAQFLLIMTLLQLPVRMLTMIVNSISRAHSSGIRVFEILDEKTSIAEKSDAQIISMKTGVIKFDNVSFSYNKAPAITDITFEASPNHTIGIVGPPGSGKSTIAHLMGRFYDPVKGHISIDGTDIREFTLKSVRESVGLVQQDPLLFDGTLRDNICYGAINAPQEQVERVAEMAQIHQFIKSLPDGYESEIGERGVSLSGGQRQRIAIARTLLLDPPIIIFDDATSSIDAGTDQRIRQELANVASERTTIIISHRLSSIKHADEILVLEDGHIIERGSPKDLLKSDSRFSELNRLQQQSTGNTSELLSNIASERALPNLNQADRSG